MKRTGSGRVGLGLLVLGGLGVVIAGAFPWSRVDGKFVEPPAHLAAAVLIFFATALGLIVFSHRFEDSRTQNGDRMRERLTAS